MTNDNFSPTSRYYRTETSLMKTAEGREVVYLRRRFLPRDMGQLLTEHVVTQGDRLDNITASYLGDPERFWSICDANLAKNPQELTSEIGRRLRIPAP